MAEYVEKTLFERALLASRLVDAAALVEASQRLPTDPPGYGQDFDDRLASRLIDRGLLNSWQVEQLRAGRTKFTLGPYRIVDAIGKGGMGHLFKGRHELLGRIEAIKVLPKSRTTPQAINSFHHEIRAQAQLDHPNLVRVSFAGRDGDAHFLVTEFVPGVDLRRLVRRCGALRADQAAWVVVQTAEALEHAHRRGLVHRDVKPGNLLVRPDGLVKVTDLGLAWYLEDSFGAAPTGDGKIVGTCDYIAPESISAPDQIMPVSDIYSLGCTLYYAVTGKVPYPGGNAVSKMRRHSNDEPIDPLSFNSTLPIEITSLILEMMEKDHHKRTPSAAAVVERLRPFVLQETAPSLASLVNRSTLPSSSRPNTTGGDASDIGETLVSLSDEALDALENGEQTEDHGEGAPDHHDSIHNAPSQTSQGTDPIGAASTETLPSIPPPGVNPPAHAAQAAGYVPLGKYDQAIRMTAAAAVGATVAIIIAAGLRYL